MSEVEAKLVNTAHVTPGLFCRACGWPVIHACCNDGMGTQEPYAGNDWWGYCSNKTCENHAGEAWGQFGLDFAFRSASARPAAD